MILSRISTEAEKHLVRTLSKNFNFFNLNFKLFSSQSCIIDLVLQDSDALAKRFAPQNSSILNSTWLRSSVGAGFRKGLSTMILVEKELFMAAEAFFSVTL